MSQIIAPPIPSAFCHSRDYNKEGLKCHLHLVRVARDSQQEDVVIVQSKVPVGIMNSGHEAEFPNNGWHVAVTIKTPTKVGNGGLCSLLFT